MVGERIMPKCPVCGRETDLEIDLNEAYCKLINKAIREGLGEITFKDGKFIFKWKDGREEPLFIEQAKP
jgi:hypothetical protein